MNTNYFCHFVWKDDPNNCNKVLNEFNSFYNEFHPVHQVNEYSILWIILGLFLYLPTAIIVSTKLNQLFEQFVVPFILNRRPHYIPTHLLIPYWLNYDLEMNGFNKTECWQKKTNEDEKGSIETSSNTVIVPSNDSPHEFLHREYEHIFVSEMTPEGLVFMRFSPSKEAFEYYSSHTISYRVLNTVARKYVIQTNNPSVYIIGNRLNPVEENIESDTESESESSDSEPEQEKSVFIKPKIAGKKVRTRTDKEIVGNNFIRLGSIAEMKLGQHQRIEKKVKPITFSDFKEIFFRKSQ